jgi:hypothetical protein
MNIKRRTLLQGPDIVLSSQTRAALERRGHDLIENNYLGAVQAVEADLETSSLTGK